MDADVIVIGAGLSGLVAASTAARRGLRVLVLDAEGEQSLGGQAFWSFGGLFLVNSPEQRRLGVKDSVELALADWLGSAGFDRPCDEWPRRWAEAYVHFAAGEKRAWLRQLGVGLLPLVQWAERGGQPVGGHGNSVPRFHITWGTGPGLVAPFAADVQDSPRIELRYRHYVDSLSSNESGVRVGGHVLAPDAAERGRRTNRDRVAGFQLTAQAVVVASGGIGGNFDLVRQNWPTAWGAAPEHLIAGVPDHVDGRMLQTTAAAGGELINSDRMWHYPEGIQNHSPLWSQHGIRILPGPSSLWLDADGVRLPAPNYPGFDSLGTLRAITSRGHDWSWFVCDLETVAKEFALSGSEQNHDMTDKDVKELLTRVRPGPTEEVQAFLDRGADFLTAGTLTELAEKMNRLTGTDQIDPGGLHRLVLARDDQVRSGLGKDPQVVATRAARSYLVDRLMRIVPPHPLCDRNGRANRSPLVAVRLHVLTRKTLGGLATNLSGQVLRADGTPLPGVYAVGEAAGFGGGGMHGYRALEGTFLGGCLFTGRQVGEALGDALRG
ncbi:FAD-binding dehydrogenase [Enemella dayhoffiae]|uniref:FAD-binding dehydrogenase n=1 Tax=Enemella dayhoffiae TaxID=2016507 RepID=A0A255H8P7_9ACTN|nr:FAD-binding dehydrogenase [Enemella dayhoffiae]OYO23971.1 FAD-binding dehydrogenase [Enemella dayhoffiae]